MYICMYIGMYICVYIFMYICMLYMHVIYSINHTHRYTHIFNSNSYAIYRDHNYII